jgi:hypothetical protein
MSVHIRITWRYIPEDGNIHNYSRENLKSNKMRLTYITNLTAGLDIVNIGLEE